MRTKLSCSILAAIVLSSATSTSHAQFLTSGGAVVDISAKYMVPSEGKDESDQIIEEDAGLSRSVSAGPNSSRASAQIGEVSFQGSAAGVQDGISNAYGSGRIAVRNANSFPILVDGVYSVEGDAETNTGGQRGQNESNGFSFRLNPGDQTLIKAGGAAIGDDVSATTRGVRGGPPIPSSSASIVFSSRMVGDEVSPFPGTDPTFTNGWTSAADISDIREVDPDGLSKEAATPAQIAGIDLVPVFGDYGQTSPLYFGSNTPSAVTAFASGDGEQIAAAGAARAVDAFGYYVGGNSFTHFTLPFALGGDTEFTVAFGDEEVPYTAGELLDFTQFSPGGVSAFFLIDEDGNVPFDATQPAPFTVGFQFANSGVTTVATQQLFLIVPEPASVALLALAGLLSIRRPRR